MALHIPSIIDVKGIPKILNSYFWSKNEVDIVFNKFTNRIKFRGVIFIKILHNQVYKNENPFKRYTYSLSMLKSSNVAQM